MQSLARQIVFKRVEPCKCGCKGTDPRHRLKYTRIVVTEDGKTGYAKLPGNTEPTAVQRYPLSDGSFTYCWFVVR